MQVKSNIETEFHSSMDEFATEKAERDAREAAEAKAKEEAEEAELSARVQANMLARNREVSERYLMPISMEIRRHAREAKRDDIVVVLVPDKARILVNGIDVTWNLEIKAEMREVMRWRHKPTGRTRITVGDYGSKVSYPQKKDGTFNYDAIGLALYHYALQKLAQQKAENVREGNKAKAAALLKEFDLPDYRGVVRPSQVEGQDVVISVKVVRNLKVEEARRVLNGLKALGIKLDN